MAELNRNYGAVVTAREFWGGNNGFLTIAVQMPSADYELPAGAGYDAAALNVKNGVATDAEIIRVSNAQRNLFRISQAAAGRAVVVALSAAEVVTATATLNDISVVVGGNIIAAARAGTTTTTAATTAPIYYVTFMIERAFVFNAQTNKPGATYAVNVDPAAELAANLSSAAFFDSQVVTQAPDGAVLTGAKGAATGVVVKVFDAMPVLK